MSKVNIRGEQIKMHQMLDSIDNEHDMLQQLINDEIEAINSYKAAISSTNDPKVLAVLSHILTEEIEHLGELRQLQTRR